MIFSIALRVNAVVHALPTEGASSLMCLHIICRRVAALIKLVRMLFQRAGTLFRRIDTFIWALKVGLI